MDNLINKQSIESDASIRKARDKLDSGEIFVHPLRNFKSENNIFLEADIMGYYLSYLTYIGNENCGSKRR